jgi:hypothetical protein
LTQIIDHVLTKSLEAVERGVDVPRGDDELFERAVEALNLEREKGATN